tara:strand:+ start:919 stop:1206 length:288 start_codon:yes stop_codon:yes gene_type:complete
MKYCTATHTGLGFYTHADRELAHLSGHPAQVWAVGDANHAWIARHSGTEKTKAEAQAIVDAQVAIDQASWDALPDDQKAPTLAHRGRPTAITLPE